jgi:hypothetical protein
MAPSKLFDLAHGASWILPDGRVIKVPGFHSSWISSHPSIASGATNTAEFVGKTGWISAVLHEGGYLELIARSLADSRQTDCLWSLLSLNAAALDRVVLLVLGMEGCIVLRREDLSSRERFDAALASPALKPDTPRPDRS